MNLTNKSEVNPKMSQKKFELDIGSKTITIEDKVTLIMGKFKRELFQQYQNKEFIDVIDELDLIPATKFVSQFQNKSDELKGLEHSLNILDFITSYLRITEYNLEVFSKFNNIIEIILSTFGFLNLTETKYQLETELSLAKKYKKSSELSAIVDLINKLKKSINENQVKLNYIKEDYLRHKNQIDQLKKTLNGFEESIKELNQIKKNCFNQINRITRQIEGNTSHQDESSLSELGVKSNLTNAEKIRALQKKAKDSQYEINQIKLKSNQTKEKLEKLTPQYNIYKNDYEAILESIREDENRIKVTQNEYERKLLDNNESRIQEIKEFSFSPARTVVEIENELSKINSELKELPISESISDTENVINLNIIVKQLKEIDDILRNHNDKIYIHKSEEELSNAFDKYYLFEGVIKDLEGILNDFLKEISLEMKFLLVINESNTLFYLKTVFERKDKEIANFEDLTTPEKIFFIVCFFLSNEVLLGHNNILFSNLFIPKIYNKGGSIYRTFRRIIPLFDTNDKLRKYKLIFVISNLELKQDINNIKIIKV